jgi:hypothetical protein
MLSSDCHPKDCSWPILLKKSAMVCASEKYASEVEIFTFGRGFRTRISRSSVQKRRFHQSMVRQFGQTDFFNRIGRFLPVMKGYMRPKAVGRTGFTIGGSDELPGSLQDGASKAATSNRQFNRDLSKHG